MPNGACQKQNAVEHFGIEIIYSDEMLRRCEALLRNARKIGTGGFCPPLSDNLKRKIWL
jgi:hypothetical protein